jgi:PAS domain S-box-containing protein
MNRSVHVSLGVPCSSTDPATTQFSDSAHPFAAGKLANPSSGENSGDFDIYRAIFDSLPASFAVIDGTGQILEANATWKQFTGANPLFVSNFGIGQNYFDLAGQVATEYVPCAEAIVQGIRQVMAGEQPDFTYEYVYSPPSGRRWFRFRATPFHSNRGHGALVIYTDITKRGEAETSLRQTELKYRSIFENATEGIFQTSLEGRYISANPMLARIYGYDSPEELINSIQNIAQQLYVNPKRREDFIQMLKEKGVVFQFESAVYHKDGHVIWISENARAVNDDNGELQYYEGTVEDITALKQAQEHIRSQAALLDKASDAIIVQDLQHHIQYWNQSAERIYGWAAADILGKNALGLIYRDIPAFQKALQEVLARGSWYGGIKQMRKDGATILMETSLTLVRNAQNEPASILAINTDVTVKRHLEDQLVHSQRLESIGTLAGGIAHDFNNILTIISGNASLGRASVPNNHPVQRHLTAIESATSRAAGVVRQILTFSRRQDTEQRIIELAPVVQEAIHFLRTTLSPKIEIRSEFAEPLPPILADATQIHQIVMNLGTNAAHAMSSHGGRLEFRVREVRLDATQASLVENLRAGNYVQMAITDTGCGMDQQTARHIFEPFFTTKKPGEGTGLGLAVVHGIVKNHNGAITVASEPGQGTVFHLYFPALDAIAAPLIPAALEHHNGGGRNILYVDDEEEIVAIAKLDLQNQGYQVTGFTLPHAALSAFYANPFYFDAAVLDISMPRMDGLELARRLLAQRPGFPIVMVSGFIRPEDHERVRSLGIKKLLEKPGTVAKVGASLTQLFKEISG